MSAPWFVMDGSIFRIRPLTRVGWIAVVAAFVETRKRVAISLEGSVG